MPIVLTNTKDCYCKEEFKYVHINKSYKGSEYFYNKMSKMYFEFIIKIQRLETTDLPHCCWQIWMHSRCQWQMRWTTLLQTLHNPPLRMSIQSFCTVFSNFFTSQLMLKISEQSFIWMASSKNQTTILCSALYNDYKNTNSV